MTPSVRLKMALGLWCFTALCSAHAIKPPTWGHRANTKANVLIVYLSRTNNIKAVAEMIQEQVGGRLVALELKNPYPQDYKAIVQQVAEENQSGFLPALKTEIEVAKYDTIFLGFPTWGMQLPPPMKSFLNQYNFKGKTLVPFNTNAGYGVGTAFKTIIESCPNSTVLQGLSLKGGIERDGIYFVMQGKKEKEARIAVLQWLSKLGISVKKA